MDNIGQKKKPSEEKKNFAQKWLPKMHFVKRGNHF